MKTWMMLGAMMAGGSAHAEEGKTRRVVERVELSAGFMGGQYDYTQLPLSLSSGKVDGAAGAVTPFSAAPYDRFEAYGMSMNLLGSIQGVRVGVGYRKPIPSFRLEDGLGKHAVVGTDREVSARAVKLNAYRFSLGYEPVHDAWSPFVDLVGEYHRVQTDLSIDGQPVSYTGSAFGFAAQGGVRVRVAPFTHIVASGEYGIVGQTRFAAHLGVAMRFGGSTKYTVEDGEVRF